MYDTQINDMVNLLVKKGILDASDADRALDALRGYWVNKIAITWDVEDVIAQAKAEEIRLSKAQAREVLQEVHRRHDATIGVNWDVISANLPRKRNA